ncbi:hypothetical protein SUGI_0097330 [Cryptomeria japonica]|uniref:protein BPS1, chloroplastic n=1 Tax=Cryptomeria japonica TaxID=3369 RepID=UPI002408E29A|nr:protein BPS1, chloroplastic [Cryptomeria japonica]GLJ08866.1 hypothetical protein SUGI_0097330 [Cryptomeria japonica]
MATMTQMGSSLLSSLGTAIQSLAYISAAHKLSSSFSERRTTEYCLVDTNSPVGEFECQLAAKLEVLKQSAKINLEWLHEALVVVAHIHSTVIGAMSGLQLPLTEMEQRAINEYLDDSVKLLDACNVIKESFAYVERYHMLVQLALHSLDSKEPVNDNKITRAKNVFHECVVTIKKKVEEVDRQGQQRSKLENCSSMLRRMGEKLNNNNNNNRSSSNNNALVISAMYGAKISTIFLCGVLSITLLVKPKRILPSLHLTHQLPWASSMLKLQHKVKEEIDRRKAIKGSAALLEELDGVHLEVKTLYNVLLNLDKEKEKGFPMMEEIRQSVPRLRKFSEDLQKRLGPVEQKVNEIYRMLVSSRVALLDIISHVKD